MRRELLGRQATTRRRVSVRDGVSVRSWRRDRWFDRGGRSWRRRALDGLSTGSRVFALAGAGGSGGYAQFALSYARTVAPIPAGLSFDVASVLLVAGTTAKLILRDVARLAPGETVLVPAATGGVGSFALQIARRRGAAKVIALVGHESKRARAAAAGAARGHLRGVLHRPRRSAR